MICEVIDLYARRYEDDFKALPQFTQTIWTVLTTTGPQPKNDVLVSKSMAFLTSVIKPIHHKQLFQDVNTLRSICSDIVLPNMQLRESDVELFEDDPHEYIRRDLEGSDSETRRRAAADLVRGLLEHFAQEVTEIFSAHVGEYLQVPSFRFSLNFPVDWQFNIINLIFRHTRLIRSIIGKQKIPLCI